jgi:hypothetical protein
LSESANSVFCFFTHELHASLFDPPPNKILKFRIQDRASQSIVGGLHFLPVVADPAGNDEGCA